MPVGYRFDYLLAQPFPKLHNPLLVTRRTEVPSFARECQKVLVTAACASDAGKSIVKVATVEIPVNDAGDIRPKEAILPLKAFLIDLFKCLKMVFNTPVIR
jgi:hypothetical protein